MKKTNLISGFALIMLLLNIGLVFFVWNKKPPYKMHDGPKELIIEKLNFDEEQVQSYELLVDEHRESSQSKFEQIGTLKDALYQTLLVENSAGKDSILLAIDNTKHEMEELNYSHFEDIKKLL